MRKHIPNALTCGNLICGCMGIIQCFESNLYTAFYWVILAAAFDFFDGFVARALKVSGDMGKELDSLADVVSFGALPAIILYKMIQPLDQYWSYAGLLVGAFSALRLAKFNLDTRQSEVFIGVPTPANTLLISSLPMVIFQNPDLQPYIQNLYFLVGLSLVMSYLLIAELPLLALKFKTWDWKNNTFKYILIGSSVVLLLFFQFSAVPMIILLYIILSIIENQFFKKAN